MAAPAKKKQISADTITATDTVKTGAGVLRGIVISSFTSGTLKLWDNTAASGTVLAETITFTTGERFIPFFDASFDTGLFCSFGGTSKITVIYE